MTSLDRYAQLLPLAASLGIGPKDFWKLSLLEWRALSGQIQPHHPRWKDFAGLSAAYPDSRPADGDPHAAT